MAPNLQNDFLPAATPGHFDFSALLNDPNIRKLAEQLQETLHEAPQDDLPNSRDPKYASTMLQIRENLDFKTMVRRLIWALMQDPSMSSMVEIYTDPSLEGQRKRRTAHLNKDPCLKLILDEIENGGPEVMMRYWNDEKVLKMFGLVMGIRPYFGDAVASFENYVPDETGDMGNEDSKNSGLDLTEDMESEDEGYVTEEDMESEDEGYVTEEDMENEDESTVHHTESTVHHIAIVDGVELCCWKLEEWCQEPSVSPIVIKSQMQIESIHEEHSLVEFMLKLNLLDLLFRHYPRGPIPYYWYGYMRAQTSRVRSSLTSTHNLPYQETQQRAGREGLLTILTRVMEEETHSVRFAQEFILALYVYHCLCNVHCLKNIDRVQSYGNGIV
ncbi:uncharacterized protein [Medicago truncatula]|uniref:uncharacterized protein isoform X1 n=1 Tax=Medicago truncatula TaxID=3880 RepID=UPI0019670382|nr:uncharacterized protein LOC25483580 isoform X1 [Medicago truncatula]